MENLEKLKTITEEGNEELLAVLLEDAEEYVLSYTGRTALPQALNKTVRDLAVIAYNRLGTEGETSRSEAGESYSFGDIPDSIYAVMNRYRLVRCGGYAHEEKQEEKDIFEEP